MADLCKEPCSPVPAGSVSPGAVHAQVAPLLYCHSRFWPGFSRGERGPEGTVRVQVPPWEHPIPAALVSPLEKRWRMQLVCALSGNGGNKKLYTADSKVRIAELGSDDPASEIVGLG